MPNLIHVIRPKGSDVGKIKKVVVTCSNVWTMPHAVSTTSHVI